MRTTVTLDPDTESLVRRLMAERGVSFKRALNDAIRAGAQQGSAPPFETRARSMGRPAIDLDRALQLAAEDEDAELIRRMRAGQ
ncbi:hypothetical protein L332_12750 [Agrococcus pavilionensis RW1]|uniref:Antitoxin n=1 Tax=Agrococcus pavilionensis RW1 TaxID=1330458 RepID=U1MXL5_9MICO|nr:hypothetical protein [Agrococcus pavilionensis]ERG65305.1 hypothetical protein L332_12750 [Agrococcus pavilionensis RW1]